MYRGAAMLPRLRQMKQDEIMLVMQDAQKHNLQNPLHLCADEKRFVVKSWAKKPLSGAQVLALLVFGLWVSVGENEDRASGLLVDWPEIKMAVTLATGDNMKEKSEFEKFKDMAKTVVNVPKEKKRKPKKKPKKTPKKKGG